MSTIFYEKTYFHKELLESSLFSGVKSSTYWHLYLRHAILEYWMFELTFLYTLRSGCRQA